MASALDICNAALALIGQRRVISALDEQSVEAEYCNLFWPMVRDECLASHTWSFATVRGALALSSATPPANYEYAYTYPNLCLKFIGVRETSATDDTVNKDCRIETDSDGNTVIYTNVEDAIGVYVLQQTNPTRFSQPFTRALEFKQAGRLAPPIIKGMDGMRVGEAWDAKGEQMLSLAKAHDANQSRERGVGNPAEMRASQLEARGLNTPDLPRIIRS